MLVGILALYLGAGLGTFDMVALGRVDYLLAFQLATFVLFYIAFAVKIPIFPFHTWLPDAHVEAPTAVSVLLAGILLKMGGYGMLRVLVGMLPDATRYWAVPLAVLAVISVLYGACVSMVQRDLKAMVAYSSISHMGYVVVGVAALTTISLSGAAIQLFTHGIITGLLFLLVGALYDKAHTRQISDFGGIARRQPLLATLFVMAGLASLGLPSLAGFIAEFTVFIGSYATLPLFTILAAAGIVITAGYILWMLQRAYFGPLNPRWENLTDVRGIEVVPLVTLMAVIVFVGVYPEVLTGVVSVGVKGLVPRGIATGLTGSLANVSMPWRLP